jgi:hypothetical protein
MSVCIVCPETLDDMEQSYILPYFAGVQDKKVELKKWTEHPYTKDELGYFVKVFIILNVYLSKFYVQQIVPIQDCRELLLEFPLGDLMEHYHASPEGYICMLR